MEPVYIDIHIHTSENADKLNANYDVDALHNSITILSKSNPILVSLSDHNTINKSAYLKLKSFFSNIIIGAELHIRNYPKANPYHCHILFKKDVTVDNIDDLNSILDVLYPKKMVSNDDDIPNLEKIVRSFDKYDFLLLPHGGQSHSTFDSSIPEGVVFDTTMERSIYYNQFDGFTARGSTGADRTREYFKKLGIVEFINLLTCSDNYNPNCYPQAKDKCEAKFVPTWMLARPTFEGLRISLSEKTRLVSQVNPPDTWQRFLSSVNLVNEIIDIDVELLPGLNVVIGGSSSGKTLFVDSLYRKITNDFLKSEYKDFKVEELSVDNKNGQVPHYIHQAFITGLLTNEDKSLGDLDILRQIFPSQADLEEQIHHNEDRLRAQIDSFFRLVESIKETENQLEKIPLPTELLYDSANRMNIVSGIVPSNEDHQKCKISVAEYNESKINLSHIQKILQDNPFANSLSNEFHKINYELDKIYKISEAEELIFEVICRAKENLDHQNRELDEETRSKLSETDQLISLTVKYKRLLEQFYGLLKEITTVHKLAKTKERKIDEYKLSVEYKFIVTEESFLSVVNDQLFNRDHKLKNLSNVEPKDFFLEKMSDKFQSKKNFSFISSKISDEICKQNMKEYKITTGKGEDFKKMSPGRKSSIILDLILGFTEDTAPIIIDQPEDNLSNDYMTNKMISSIKDAKRRKQIIFVTHTASIPMLGDAQNIILCENKDNKITIRSAPLEDEINGKKVVDYVASLTDGGKASVKKRFKKYNMKSFVGEK